MSIEQRPAVYLPSMTPEEVISYANSYAETALEKELLLRYTEAVDKLQKE